MDREKVIEELERLSEWFFLQYQVVYDGDAPDYYDAYKTVDDALALLKEQEAVVRCKDCKHGSLYCTEDVCGETLIECNRPDLGDVIEIHGWKWFCADGIMEVKS